MRRLLFNQQVMMAALAVMLLLLSILPGRWVHAISSRPRHIVESIRAPFAAPLHSVATSMRRPPDEDIKLVYGNDDLETLHMQLYAYSQRLVEENAQLRRRLEIYEGANLRLAGGVRAEVARVTGTPDTYSLQIDKGTMDGIYPNMVVASDEIYLVGRIVDAGPKSATVQLILSPGTNLMATIKAPIPPEAPGMPERSAPALLKVAPTGDRLTDDVRQDAEVQSGDLAHLVDDKWPPEAAGLVIGKVATIEVTPDDTLQRTVVVVPIRSLKHLSHVVVLIPDVRIDDSRTGPPITDSDGGTRP